MNISGVYKITDKENNKVYIGSSHDILTRWQEHIEHSFNSNRLDYNYPLQIAIREKGINNFIFECLEINIYDELELFKIENNYIQQYDSINNGYNQINGHQIKNSKRRIWDEKELQLLEKLINDGLSYKEIGQRLNRSSKSINTKASRLKIGLRINNSWDVSKELKMLELRNQGLSQLEVSQILGFSKEAVKKRWHDIYSKTKGAWNNAS